MDSLSSLPATTQPLTTSANPPGSNGAAITVSSNIAGTDTVTVASGDTKNEMPDKAPGKEGGAVGDSISDKTVKETKADAQMSDKGAGDVEETGSEAGSEESAADAGVTPRESDEKEQLKSMAYKLQSAQIDDGSETPEAAAEQPELEKNDSPETEGETQGADEGAEPEEVIENTQEEGKKEES
ncbi:hypothetical protein [Endozoicomonas sp. GU-1]|uniref:hypothetical protein n=1 Tax=Endozoicomonas sp. GU-1 TaxID=3009078 RepID=UPI0022B55545|nr:hypothetical protein [Endozoicomonas sp. GU-1]WBA87509.1 hypothetical protein O3276_05630 [Endozoicomonas sp. GU-1]